jgi:ABC-type nitrate/sulfonate/bicarbonate transport system permease component
MMAFEINREVADVVVWALGFLAFMAVWNAVAERLWRKPPTLPPAE